jgi:protein gp37
MAFAKRLAGRYGYPKLAPFSVTFHPKRLDQPKRWTKPRTVFVCSMGDLFHADVADKTVTDIFTVMAETKWHTYMVLTKRPLRMTRWLRSAPGSLLHQVQYNVWLGVSAEDQQRAEERMPLLVAEWPGRRVACLEPLLGPIYLRAWLHKIDWVITGGETGAGGRKANREDLRIVRDQCIAANVPLFFKQWGGQNNKQLENTLDDEKWEQLGGYIPREVRG